MGRGREWRERVWEVVKMRKEGKKRCTYALDEDSAVVKTTAFYDRASAK
jgi:hypothetical protein